MAAPHDKWRWKQELTLLSPFIAHPSSFHPQLFSQSLRRSVFPKSFLRLARPPPLQSRPHSLHLVWRQCFSGAFVCLSFCWKTHAIRYCSEVPAPGVCTNICTFTPDTGKTCWLCLWFKAFLSLVVVTWNYCVQYKKDDYCSIPQYWSQSGQFSSNLFVTTFSFWKIINKNVVPLMCKLQFPVILKLYLYHCITVLLGVGRSNTACCTLFYHLGTL